VKFVEKKFSYSMENFRGLSIIFVVLCHLQLLQDFGRGGDYIRFFFTDATTWFVFISGYLFHHTQHARFGFSKYMQSKAKYVLLPYLMLSVPAVLLGIHNAEQDLAGLSLAKYTLWSLAVGGAVIPPMWFVPMIALFFLFSPLSLEIAKTRMLYVVTLAGLVLSLFSVRPANNLNPLLSFVHFFGFYFLGILFSARKEDLERLKKRVNPWLMVFFGMAIFIAAMLLYKGVDNSPQSFHEGLGRLNAYQLGKLGLLLSAYFLLELRLNRPCAVLGYFAKISFGLFFLHGFFMIFWAELYPYIDIDDLSILLALEVACIGICPLLIIHGLRYLFGQRSRYVIGC
jgi:surface polysaccharide O-acyltransferase-like enzyme